MVGLHWAVEAHAEVQAWGSSPPPNGGAAPLGHCATSLVEGGGVLDEGPTIQNPKSYANLASFGLKKQLTTAENNARRA